MSAMLLSIKDLRVAFRTGKVHGVVQRFEAVKGVSFDVPENTTVALVGESGSGKSVTAMSILNLLPENAERTGAITFHGRDMLATPLAELQKLRGREIACVFQDPMSSLNPVFTVGQQLCEPLVKHLGMKPRQAMARAEALLVEVGMPEPKRRLSAYPHQRLAPAHAEMADQRLAQLRADAEHRIQRGHRVLEHAGNLAPAQRLQLRQRCGQQVAALEADRAAALGVLGQQVQDRHRGDALARARLADQRDGGVLGHVEADAGVAAAHRLRVGDVRTAPEAEAHAQVVDGQQHHSAPRSFGSNASRSASVINENAVTNTAMNAVAAASCHQ